MIDLYQCLEDFKLYSSLHFSTVNKKLLPGQRFEPNLQASQSRTVTGHVILTMIN